MNKFIRTGGGSKNSLYQGGGGVPNKNLCLFTDIEDLQDVDVDIDVDFNGEFDINIDDIDDDNYKNIINNSLKTTKLIDDIYYFNNSNGNKYIFKIKSTNKVWKLNDLLKKKNGLFI